jgi:hypothetical protein
MHMGDYLFALFLEYLLSRIYIAHFCRAHIGRAVRGTRTHTRTVQTERVWRCILCTQCYRASRVRSTLSPHTRMARRSTIHSPQIFMTDVLP